VSLRDHICGGPAFERQDIGRYLEREILRAGFEEIERQTARALDKRTKSPTASGTAQLRGCEGAGSMIAFGLSGCEQEQQASHSDSIAGQRGIGALNAAGMDRQAESTALQSPSTNIHRAGTEESSVPKPPWRWRLRNVAARVGIYPLTSRPTASVWRKLWRLATHGGVLVYWVGLGKNKISPRFIYLFLLPSSC
jgi:hypothetical protein